jgi:hypothetical protein
MKKTFLLLATLALSLTSAHSALLLGWYRFDDPTDLGKDYSGNNNNGTVFGGIGAPIYTANGYTGGAADFLGGGQINIPFNTGPTLWPDLTWGGWVNPDLIDGVRTLLNNDDGGYDRALNIDFRADGNYAAFVNNGPLPYNSGVAPVINSWIFFAGVYQNNFYGTGQGQLTLYVGTNVISGIRTFYGSTGWTFTSIGGSPTFGEYWDGRMDDVFVMGGAATPEQMAQIMADPNNLPAIAAQVGVVPEPGTWAAAALLVGGAGYVRWRKRAKVC